MADFPPAYADLDKGHGGGAPQYPQQQQQAGAPAGYAPPQSYPQQGYAPQQPSYPPQAGYPIQPVTQVVVAPHPQVVVAPQPVLVTHTTTVVNTGPARVHRAPPTPLSQSQRAVFGLALIGCAICTIFYIAAAAANSATVLELGVSETRFGFYEICVEALGDTRCRSYGEFARAAGLEDECDFADKFCQFRRTAAAFCVFAILASFGADLGGFLSVMNVDASGPNMLIFGSGAATACALITFASWARLQDSESFDTLDVEYGPSFALVVTGFVFNLISTALAIVGANMPA